MEGTRGIPLKVLVVDDEPQTLQSCRIVLRSSGIENVVCCDNSLEVMEILHKNEVGVVLLDLTMPTLSGEELLPMIREEFPNIPVIIITGVQDIDTAVKCMKQGAFDYMVKPIEKSRLISGVMRALEIQELHRENIMLKQRILSDTLEEPEAFAEIITNNSQMKSIFQYVEAIAKTNQPVLLTGETGVGKELLARAIHKLSRRKGEFVPVNVAGLDDTLFSDTLFGHKKGAFTGADCDRQGLVEKASGGTLFLDEIGDLSISSQSKLLRLIQECEYLPLGSDVLRRSDARIIVATNQSLKELMQQGKFRKDLYYRLHTHYVHIPPLRERLDDLPLLVEHFLEEAAAALGKKKPTPPPELFQLLATYHFPGNVRELRSMIFDAVSKHRSGKLSLEVFKDYVFHSEEQLSPGSREKFTSYMGKSGSMDESEKLIKFSSRLPTLKEATRLLIEEAMRRAQGNQTIAARLLGISQQALSKRLKRIKG